MSIELAPVAGLALLLGARGIPAQPENAAASLHGEWRPVRTVMRGAPVPDEVLASKRNWLITQGRCGCGLPTRRV